MKYLKYAINYILSFGYDMWHFFFGDMRSRIMGLPYYKKSKQYPGYLKQGNMSAAVLSLAQTYCTGRGLDVGGGPWPFPGARTIEDHMEENAYKIQEQDGSIDFIFSSHTLEHLAQWKDALREWHRILKPGGVMFLYLPHAACEMWEKGINPQHVWTPTSEIICQTVREELSMTVEQSTSLPDGFLSFIVVVKK